MVGGEQKVFEKAKSILELMGKNAGTTVLSILIFKSLF
jgi:3-hydroxyisobutyrate dehydrogenase-like beta-hydroxyacid dehydrogenase